MLVSRRFKLHIAATLVLVACASGAQQLQPPAAAHPQAASADPDARKAELRARLAEIEGRIQKELGKRVKYISPSGADEPFWTYYRAFAERVEAAGTANFPRNKEGASVYGKVHLLVYVGADGRIQKMHTAETDSAFLEKHTMRTVRSTAPLEPFSPEMKRIADSVVMSARLHYRKD
jgi:outer membrane biosynthesis protein TonB